MYCLVSTQKNKKTNFCFCYKNLSNNFFIYIKITSRHSLIGRTVGLHPTNRSSSLRGGNDGDDFFLFICLFFLKRDLHQVWKNLLLELPHKRKEKKHTRTPCH